MDTHFLLYMYLVCFFMPFNTDSTSSFDSTIHPDPENCQNYYLCGSPEDCTLESCDSILLFDEVVLACNFAQFVDCGDRPSPIQTTTEYDHSTISYTTDIFPDPNNCQNYYLCGSPDDCTLESCDPELLFDTEVLACNFADFVDCGDRPNPIETTTNEDKSTISFLKDIFPDPENCQNYYLCSSPDDCTLQSCDEGLLFDDVISACNFAEAVDCGDRPNPYQTTINPGPSTTTKFVPTTSDKITSPKTTTSTTTSTTTPSTTTTSKPLDPTTTPDNGERYPERVLGMYLALADDGIAGYHTDDLWAPKLYEYQQKGSNVLFFTFINPESMEVPVSFKNLASTRGSDLVGSVPADTKIVFAIGGYTYSMDPNPWEWLTTKDKAESMAEVVASWKDLYNCDGIDLDIEEGAGNQEEAGRNMVHFIRKLRELQPNIIIGQPTYGYPQIPAEVEVINESYNIDRSSNNLADSVGIMAYEGTESLLYVRNFAEASSQGQGFPITCNTPYNVMLVGCKGTNSISDIETLANESLNQDLLGIMVWYASVIDGFQYAKDWDASFDEDSKSGFVSAMEILSNG